jgi:uncharacterized repeat protein (TIGR01451 family)
MKQIRWWLPGVVAASLMAAVALEPPVYGQQELPQIKPPVSLPTPPTPPATAPANPPPLTPVSPPLTPVPATTEPQAVTLPAPKLEPLSPVTPKATGPATEVRLGRQEPAVSIEWAGPPMVRLNQPMTCQLFVRNTSGVAVHNVIVRHRPSQGVTYRSSEPQPAVDEGELVWLLGTLAAGQVRRIDLQMVVQVKGPLTCQATVTFSGAATHQVQVSEPQLQIKMKGPDRVLGGEPVTLLYTISNPGDGPAEAVKLKTLLPDGLQHPHGKTIEVELGTLAPREVRTLQLVCNAHGGGAQKCQTVVTAEGGLKASDEVALDIVMPKLDLAVTGPKLRYIDRKAIYLIKVANPGSALATNVVVHGVVPASFKYHAANASGSFDEGTRTATWVLGDLPPGQSREVALEVVPTAPGDHKIVGQVASARGLKTEAEAHTAVAGLPSLLIEVGATDDAVEVGAEMTYEVRVTNKGTKTESNVEVVCTLPEQVEFRSAKCAANLHHSVEGREVVFEPIAKLAPRADVIYRVQVRSRAAGDVRFRVRVRAEGLQEPIMREECTRLYNDDGK